MKSIKQYLTMSRVAWFALGFVCAVVLMVTSGAGPASSSSDVGTYHIETGEGGVYLLDTRTGQLWHRTVMYYHDLGTPQEPVYKSSQLNR